MQPAAAYRSGLADCSIRFSVNLTGGPAMSINILAAEDCWDNLATSIELNHSPGLYTEQDSPTSGSRLLVTSRIWVFKRRYKNETFQP